MKSPDFNSSCEKIQTSLHKIFRSLEERHDEKAIKKAERETEMLLEWYDKLCLDIIVYKITNLEKSQQLFRDRVYSDFVQRRLKILGKDMPERELRILCKRYGFGGEKPCTLEKIGQQEGLLKEGVRHIVYRAISLLDGYQSISKGRRPSEEETREQALLNTPLESCWDISPKTARALRRNHIVTIGRIINETEESLLDLPGIGAKSIRNIKKALGREGLTLRKPSPLNRGQGIKYDK